MAVRERSEAERRLRGRNLAVGIMLLGCVVLLYLVAIVRMGGG